MAKIRKYEGPIEWRSLHTIPSFPDGDRDRLLHWHTFKMDVEVLVEIDDEKGYAFDHRLIREAAAVVTAPLHNVTLNSLPGLERGLTEDLLLRWLLPKMQERIEPLGGILAMINLRQESYDKDQVRVHGKIWRIEDQG